MSYAETSPPVKPDEERDPSQPGLAPKPGEDPGVGPEPSFPRPDQGEEDDDDTDNGVEADED